MGERIGNRIRWNLAREHEGGGRSRPPLDPLVSAARCPKARRRAAGRARSREGSPGGHFQPGNGYTPFFFASFAGNTVSDLPFWYWMTGITSLFWFVKPS
jgi:hypothetical protein